MNFSQGHSGTKIQCESSFFLLRKNTPEFTKMGEIHELFVLALSLVWFAGATPEQNRFQAGGVFFYSFPVSGLQPETYSVAGQQYRNPCLSCKGARFTQRAPTCGTLVALRPKGQGGQAVSQRALYQGRNHKPPPPGEMIWAVIWGGAKRMGGGKRTRERALPKIFGPLQKSFWSALSWIFVQEKQSTDTWGGWTTYRTRGGPKPLFGRGVIREVFHPPLFSTPPWRPLNDYQNSNRGDSRESIHTTRFTRIDSQKNPYFHNVRAIHANRLKPAIRNF